MDFVITAAGLILLLVCIVVLCELFTNAVEHLGESYKVGHDAVGSIFAAIGTTLPETIVPLVAILGAYIAGSDNLKVGQEIGMGAILGSPFMICTLAMFVTAIGIMFAVKLGRRSKKIDIDSGLFKRDLRFFTISYSFAVLAAFVPILFVKYLIGALLLVFYLVYAIRTIKKSCETYEKDEDHCEQGEGGLYFHRIIKYSEKAHILIIWCQILISIFGLVYFSHLFVENMKFISNILHISPFIISLLLAPIATELPEMFNSVLWVNKSKDTLAFSNLTGAMVFQSCIPMAIGIFLTDWHFHSEVIVNVLLVYCSLFILTFGIIKNKGELTLNNIIFSGIFYFIYIIYLVLRTIL